MKKDKTTYISRNLFAIIIHLSLFLIILSIVISKQDNKNYKQYTVESPIQKGEKKAIEYYLSYQRAPGPQRKIIRSLVRHEFANFDETKLQEPLKTFIYNCKYK